MTSFTNLVETLEKLAFEILLWVIFIPKTLFKIIWNPSWVPAYIDEELAKEKGRFLEYLSPLILLTIIVVGMAGAIQWGNSLSGVDMVVPQTAITGEETTLYAKPQFAWNDYSIFGVWIILNETGEIEDVFVRYKFDPSNLDDPNTAMFKKFIEKNQDLIKEENISREDNSITTSELIYSWKKAGRYSVLAGFYGNKGGRVSNIDTVYVSNPGEIAQPLPFVEERINLFDPIFDNSILGSESVFKNRELSAGLVLTALFIPLLIALSSHLLKGGNLSRAGLQRHLYIHTMYFSPLLFSGLILTLLGSSLFELLQSEFQDYSSPTVWYFWGGSLLLYWLIFGWFIFAETRFFIRELKKPALIFLACIIAVWMIWFFTSCQSDSEFPYSIISGSFWFQPVAWVYLSNSSSLQLIVAIYFAIMGLPPLGYVAFKYLPGIWENLLQSISRQIKKR